MRFHTEPATEWKNIFQLWKENGKVLPFKVAKNSWSAEAGHYLIIESIEIKKWPYGSAWGYYHWNGGVPGPRKVCGRSNHATARRDKSVEQLGQLHILETMAVHFDNSKKSCRTCEEHNQAQNAFV